MEDGIDNVFWFTVDGEEKLATENLIPKKQVYKEKLIIKKGIEYRLWDPFRSKLAASIMNGLENFPFKTRSFNIVSPSGSFIVDLFSMITSTL